jgi:error-prone DNA polymerase
MQYVELHCHSNFSFLDGASHPEDLIKTAAKLSYPALALTDHNGLYGIVRLAQAAREYGVRPIFGAEVTLSNGHHLVLLIKNEAGYANLSRLLTIAQIENAKGEAKLNPETLAENSKGLIALSGCPQGEIPSLLLKNEIGDARYRAGQYREMFGKDNFYLELQHHHLPKHEQLCEKLAALSRKLGIPIVATNNVHYSTPELRKLQDVLTCIRNHTTIDNANGWLYPNAERYLKSAEQMRGLFAAYPDAIANTLTVASRCDFVLGKLKTSLPDFPVPAGETVESYLRHLTYEGARCRYGELTEVVEQQLEHELRIINKLDLGGYFLIVWDLARFCKLNGILCQGRGSAANSAVCYCLEITAVDPIRLKLLFERFISEERQEPPDIDIDIAHNRREEVIQYVYAKYGRDHAGMVCEIISYRGRSAVRDVGKALGFSLADIDRLAKLLDHFSDKNEIETQLEEAKLNVDHHRARLLAELVKEIRSFPRHLGIHVGGMIITKRPLSEIVPIENATMPDRSVIQWDKDDCGDVGMVKIDLLGLGMLSMIDIATRLVREHHGVTIDPAKLGYDDPKVYDLLCTADTVGIFQVESRAQMNTLPRHKPRVFYDLVIEVALIRPGPIQGDMVHPYLRRRNGEEEVTYPHPKLQPILQRTLGIPLFQEQGMQVAVATAGFTASEADELRRAMGHKRSRERMESLSLRLISGMVKNGIDREAAEKIFMQLAAFADFGFAESHAASFALLVYVSAFFKVYYPREFYCALLNAQPLGFYSPSTIVYEGRRRGVSFNPVDIARSRWDCAIEGDGIRLGFRYIKSLGPTAKEKIENELAVGPFLSLSDFVRRTELNRDSLEQLALVNAFQSFGLSRRQALWQILALASRGESELPIANDHAGEDLLAPMNATEELVADFGGMELSTGPHPMSLARTSLAGRGVLSSNDIRRLHDKQRVTVAGIVIIRQRPMTAKGFLFLTLEDECGFFNIVVKPRYVTLCRKAVVYSNCLMVKGTLECEEGVINIMGEQFIPLRFGKIEDSIVVREFR